MSEGLKRYDAFNAKPFVGYISSGESIEILEEKGTLVCRQSKSATAIMAMIALVILFCVGFAIDSPDMHRYIRAFQHAELIGKLGFAFVAVLITGLLGMTLAFSLKKLFANTRIIVNSTGTLHFYSGGKAQPEKTVSASEIERLYLDTISFQGKHQTHINTLLVLRLKSEEEIVLCAAVKREMMERLGQEIARRANIPLHLSPEESG